MELPRKLTENESREHLSENTQQARLHMKNIPTYLHWTNFSQLGKSRSWKRNALSPFILESVWYEDTRNGIIFILIFYNLINTTLHLW